MQRGIRPADRHRGLVRKDLDRIGARFGLDAKRVLEMKAVAAVLPFRTNAYVLENLIHWHEVPDDPVFQSTFPQAGMLESADLERMMRLVGSGAPAREIRTAARAVRQRLQSRGTRAETANIPRACLQHVYRDAVLFCPSGLRAGRAYSTFCFCWPPQAARIRQATRTRSDATSLRNYLAAHREVSSVLLAGGDSLAMEAGALRRCVEPLLGPEHEHLIRVGIGSKAPAHWPQRFLGDPDTDELLRLFEQVQAAGKQLTLLAHYVHPRELETKAAQDAVRRIRATGVVVRCETPVVRRVNDDAATWAALWRSQVKAGGEPSSMFVEEDAGPRDYFEVPLARAWQIYRDAYAQAGGIARTVRGPSMRAAPGKVHIVGEARIHGERLFVLELLQARDPRWVRRPFFARWDAKASRLDQLRPAFGENVFFYDEALRRMEDAAPREAVPQAPRSVTEPGFCVRATA
jgi:L-lysine 2,3-aminomutase